MTEREIILLTLCLIFAVFSITLLLLQIKNSKNIKRLSSRIEDFIQSGKRIGFSTKDNNFAVLQNNICNLEEMLEQEKKKSELEAQKSAEFISDISHQLKTPIAGLRLYVEMENEINPSEHTKKELLLIEKTENLIRKLIRLEKIKTDAYVMNFQFYELSDIINDLIYEFRSLFPNKKYLLSGGGAVRCDREWINEAIGNVIKNASEHTADNGTIEITVEESEKSTSVCICDNGGGVPEEELVMLFKRFHKTSDSKPGSAGIGLSITKAIIEKHHGTICAENRNGGLSVIMCFPHIDGYITI